MKLLDRWLNTKKGLVQCKLFRLKNIFLSIRWNQDIVITKRHSISIIQTESYLLAHDIEPVQRQYSQRKIIIIVATSILALFKVGTFIIVYIKRKLLIKLWSILVLISCFGHIAISDFDSLVFEITTFAMIIVFISSPILCFLIVLDVIIWKNQPVNNKFGFRTRTRTRTHFNQGNVQQY